MQTKRAFSGKQVEALTALTQLTETQKMPTKGLVAFRETVSRDVFNGHFYEVRNTHFINARAKKNPDFLVAFGQGLRNAIVGKAWSEEFYKQVLHLARGDTREPKTIQTWVFMGLADRTLSDQITGEIKKDWLVSALDIFKPEIVTRAVDLIFLGRTHQHINSFQNCLWPEGTVWHKGTGWEMATDDLFREPVVLAPYREAFLKAKTRDNLPASP